MSQLICPLLYAGLLANESGGDALEEAACLRDSCAWWDSKYKMCYIEMIMLRS